MSADVRDKLLGRKDSGARVQVVTPEGVPLSFVIAHAGDRANAFFIDAFIIVVSIVALAIGAAYATGVTLGGSWIGAFAILMFFLLRNFYFMWFELRWQGRTPGKRLIGLRVIDRHGGPLTADAIIARNLTREIEIFLPLAFLVAPEMLWPTAPGWARLVAGLWLLVIALLPLFNHLRLRVGDLVAGTMVVLAPRAVLLEDQSAHAAAGAPAPLSPAAARNLGLKYAFTDAQLDIYGIYELQVLEDVLRQAAGGGVEAWTTMETVAQRIQRKIGWDVIASGPVDVERFLRDFYAALRARLEHRMLLGERREDKYARKK